MKLDTRALAYGVALSAAIAWIICSILVALAPTASMVVSKDMFHLAGQEIAWGLTWGSFLVGLVGWTVLSGLFAALCGGLYNRFAKTRTTEALPRS